MRVTGADLDYLLQTQNSNSFIKTVLYVIGNDQNFISLFAAVDLTFPGWERNVLFQAELGWTTTTGIALSLAGTAGNDIIRTGNGNDTLEGVGGNDNIYGGSGNDSFLGGGGNDIFFGGTGNDRMFGGADADWLFGEVGNDTLWGDGGNDDLYGGTGNDQLVGGADADRLFGEVGNDTLWGGTGNDVIYGGTGNHRIFGGGGADILIGGTGYDVFVFSGTFESNNSAGDVLRGDGLSLAFWGAGANLGDTIDVSGIDANATVTGNQWFQFGPTGIGTISLAETGTTTLVRGSTDFDAEFEFILAIEDGTVRASSYTAADFIL